MHDSQLCTNIRLNTTVCATDYELAKSPLLFILFSNTEQPYYLVMKSFTQLTVCATYCSKEMLTAFSIP